MASHCHNQCRHFAHSCAFTMCNQSSCGCCCGSKNTAPSSQPVIHDSDHLLQTLALLLQCRQEEPKVDTRYLPQGFPKRKIAYGPKTRASWDSPSLGESHGAVASLLQRISYLECAIREYPPYSKRYDSCSLREAAARVIQSSFRAFLVRRSRALRQLQELGRLKRGLLSLKSLVSSNVYCDQSDVSLKVMNFMREIELMEDDHPMIRDGKRSIIRDLAVFLDHIEGVSPVNARKNRNQNVANLSREMEMIEDLRCRVEKIDRCLPNNSMNPRTRKYQIQKPFRSKMVFDQTRNRKKAGFSEDVKELDVFEDSGGASREEFVEGEDFLDAEAQFGKSFKKLSFGYNGDSLEQSESFS